MYWVFLSLWWIIVCGNCGGKGVCFGDCCGLVCGVFGRSCFSLVFIVLRFVLSRLFSKLFCVGLICLLCLVNLCCLSRVILNLNCLMRILLFWIFLFIVLIWDCNCNVCVVKVWSCFGVIWLRLGEKVMLLIVLE